MNLIVKWWNKLRGCVYGLVAHTVYTVAVRFHTQSGTGTLFYYEDEISEAEFELLLKWDGKFWGDGTDGTHIPSEEIMAFFYDGAREYGMDNELAGWNWYGWNNRTKRSAAPMYIDALSLIDTDCIVDIGWAPPHVKGTQ